ncbi:MAG: hypothetical protein CMD68_00915 [Gammaproteobacteria bacterium]|nr:hypothetical protein [Gammaproteobacteria bacterium]
MKLILFLICAITLVGCSNEAESNDIDLSTFIKPEYSFKESSFKCELLNDKTLNTVERFIPKFIDNYLKIGNDSDELFFMFPAGKDEAETKFFELLLIHQELDSIDKFNLTLVALDFGDIANCESSTQSSNSLSLTKKTILDTPAIAEILECNYKEGFNYATIKLVFEQFTDALIKNNGPVNISYSEENNANNNFRWTNVFPSLESRKRFLELWQELEISKDIQSLLLEQSNCKSSKIFFRYKVL